jgi:chemotaxis protein MotB
MQIIDLRIDRLQHVAQQLRDKLGQVPLLDSLKQNIEITMTDEGLRIELLEDTTGTFFHSGSSVVSERGHILLDLIGHELARDSGNRILVEGHTDARPYVNRAGYTNYELSADRANSARRIVNEAGVELKRIAGIRGLADQKLRYPDAPFDSRNRRVSITVLLDKTVGGWTAPVDSIKRRVERRTR